MIWFLFTYVTIVLTKHLPAVWKGRTKEKKAVYQRQDLVKEKVHLSIKYFLVWFHSQVHVSESATVPDHCKAYVLSDSDDPENTSTYDHHHSDSCDWCLPRSPVVREIEEVSERAGCSDIEKEELKFVIAQTKQSIESWKAHLLRSTNQDECRLDVLRGLSASSILLLLDWAMKFLPWKFRESQCDWNS